MYWRLPSKKTLAYAACPLNRVTPWTVNAQTRIIGRVPLADLVASQAGALSRGEKLRLTRTDAEQLRGCLTTRLAVIGFGENYAINEQGRILEKLIDRFYLR